MNLSYLYKKDAASIASVVERRIIFLLMINILVGCMLASSSFKENSLLKTFTLLMGILFINIEHG